MFTLRDRRTGELFDRWSDFGDKRRRLMEQSWAGVFRNHLLVELPVDDLCRHLDERMGRPSKDLHVVIGVLLLQQLHDLSDACIAPGSLDTSLSHAAGLSDIAVCHA